ncbi:hypothetical protein DSM106972_080300 [Dulcicalothrix desertica PCC 7102]|uniref:EVE domain-containing protein n=1 Tax=Dulcicalothrix desertica PCC 7102 TaxID=232991 RepID=A0A3S1C1N0_9CYAN|nr:hypothetical protein [Dulcicalothrix desertica]RUS98644.1 hypothetical protein DSM106972_080300 [Dulcicalothrix desertica PCC 7102]TWH43149.1 hypothetical protein CAL7102_06849 [Dulcicalothrix desertica PCC 7102]
MNQEFYNAILDFSSSIKDAIHKLDIIYWLVTRYTKEIKPSDNVLIWIAGKDAGIYATAEVIDILSFMDEHPDIDIWTMPIRAKARFYAPVKFTQKLLNNPLLKKNYNLILFYINYKLYKHHLEQTFLSLIPNGSEFKN